MSNNICESYNSCIVTPKQVYPNQNYYYNGNVYNTIGFNNMNCVSYIPTQECGLIVGDNYNFSDGYSIDDQFYKQPMAMNTTLDVNNYNWLYGNEGNYVPVEGTEVMPEAFVNGSVNVSLTPSFFAANSAFRRIPIKFGKKIFRRRKPGDCTSEWSNAFENEVDCNECDVPCCSV